MQASLDGARRLPGGEGASVAAQPPPSTPLGRVPRSFSSPYSAAKFAVDSFFASLRRELDVQDVNVAITMCVLGLWDRASAAEGVR